MHGLELKNILSQTSEIEKFNVVDATSENFVDKFSGYLGQGQYKLIMYLDNKVLIGYYRQNTFTFPCSLALQPKFIQRLRIFDKSSELLIWRSGNKFRGRKREDGKGENTEVVDTKQILYGTEKVAEAADGFSKICEKRGATLELPGEFTVSAPQEDANDSKEVKTAVPSLRAALHVRNYIGYNAIHMAGYVDCRFVDFVQKGKRDEQKKQEKSKA